MRCTLDRRQNDRLLRSPVPHSGCGSAFCGAGVCWCRGGPLIPSSDPRHCLLAKHFLGLVPSHCCLYRYDKETVTPGDRFARAVYQYFACYLRTTSSTPSFFQKKKVLIHNSQAHAFFSISIPTENLGRDVAHGTFDT